MPYSIQIFKVGEQIGPTVEVTFMEGFDTWEPLWFNIAVLRGEGRTVVINTGFPEDVEKLRQAWASWDPRAVFTRHDEEKVPAVLARAGVRPEEVDIVIITPLGGYSTGNISLFKRAQICIHKRGWLRFIAPPEGGMPPPRRDLVMPPSELFYLVTEGMARLRLLEDEDVVAPGIRTYYSGAHHPSSISILIDTPKGVAVYTDSFFKLRNLEQMKPIGVGYNLEEAWTALQRARREATIFIPAYDPELFTRYPDGVIA